MKPILFCLFLGGIMLLASIACSLGSVGVEWEPTPTNVSRTMADQLTPKLPASQTESAPQGGFITGTLLDAATLPRLTEVPSGGAPRPCFVDNSTPILDVMYDVFPHRLLCLNNFPTAPDSPNIIVTLVDPAGHTFSETFTYSQDHILNLQGMNVGYVEHGEGIDGQPGTPGVAIDLYMPASLPGGDWSISAKTQDGKISAGPTIFNIKCDSPCDSILSEQKANPFIHPDYAGPGPAFANGQTIYFVGAAYSPNSAVRVAFYQEDPVAGKSEAGFSLFAAKYAASVTTDSAGNFQAQFFVDSATLRGSYYAVAAPVITSDIHLSALGTAQFSIQ